jgi:hypothetical protein
MAESARDRHLRRSRIALGVCVICAVFGLETGFAHHKMPSPLSPLVWGLLGVIGVGALVVWAWSRAQARRAG